MRTKRRPRGTQGRLTCGGRSTLKSTTQILAWYVSRSAECPVQQPSVELLHPSQHRACCMACTGNANATACPRTVHNIQNYTRMVSRHLRRCQSNDAASVLCFVQAKGVRTSDGDGTVPLISTGLMCYKGWRTKRLNPAGIPIISREYTHNPTTAFKDLR